MNDEPLLEFSMRQVDGQSVVIYRARIAGVEVQSTGDEAIETMLGTMVGWCQAKGADVDRLVALAKQGAKLTGDGLAQ